MGQMGAGHFLYIPVTIVVGIVIGWMLGTRAARDAYAVERKKREAAAARLSVSAPPPAAAPVAREDQRE
jgi:hypothetical protein